MDSQITVAAPRAVSRGFDPDELIAEWGDALAADVAAGDKSPDTARTYRRGMRHFMAWFGSQCTYKAVGPRAIQSWRVHLRQVEEASANTVNTHLAGVRSFFAWAVAERRLAYNPTAGVKAKSAGKRHKRDPLSDAEVVRVLAQPDVVTPTGKRDKAMLCLMAYTGARQVEVERARLGDLRSDGKLRLWVWGKGQTEPDEALYLVHPEMVEAMYDWLAVHPHGDDPQAPLFCGLGNRNHGGALARQSIRRLVKGYYRGAGIRDARKTTHSLRHSLVTNLIRHGLAPTRIMAVTRHKSLDTILTYAHEVDRDDDPAEAYVDYGNGRPE